MKNVSHRVEIFKPDKYYLVYYENLLYLLSSPFHCYYITKDKGVRCSKFPETGDEEFYTASYTGSWELEMYFKRAAGQVALEMNSFDELKETLNKLNMARKLRK